MPLAHVYSSALVGIEAIAIDVEVDNKASDKSQIILVGLPDLAVKESKDRVLAALRNSGFALSNVSCTINLAPAALKKEGAFYDLPIALGILQATGQLGSADLGNYLCIGELSLSGSTRAIRGALAAGQLARQLGKKGIILPKANAHELRALPLTVIGVDTIAEACKFLKNPALYPKEAISAESQENPYQPPEVDLQEIKGQAHVKRALEIAAAGNHNILLYGPPGTGKTMLAKALGGILPSLSVEEALEVTTIFSVAGLLPPKISSIRTRPFRSPHHTISTIGLVGGGSSLRPGELSLAHNGVLFLDELPEFTRTTLEALRQPLENGKVTIARATGTATFPTRCLFIAAMNPCPCGHLGHPQKPCSDTALQIQRYRSKISGPLLERIDMQVEVPVVPFQEIQQSLAAETSRDVQSRVIAARKLQQGRLGPGRTNSTMRQSELAHCATLDTASQRFIGQAMQSLGLSMRSYNRILKVSRTIADLAASPSITQEHLLEALSFRGLDTKSN